MDLHELNVLINVAGISTSAMHEAAVALDQSDPRVVALIRSIERHGDQDLKAIQQWSNGAKDGAQRSDAQIPPGYRVVDVGDVGDTQGHGAQHAASLSLPNWAYVQQHNLMAKWAQIFADTLEVVNAAIGTRPGDLTHFGDGDPIIRGEGGAILGDLSAWG